MSRALTVTNIFDARERASTRAPFSLDDLTVFPSRCAVVGPNGEQRLEPKVMSVLLRLAEQPLEVVSRRELLDSVWADMVVGDQVLTRTISELRKGLTQAKLIQTIPKTGYRLTCRPTPVTGPTEEAHAAGELLATLLRKGLRTVAVLPMHSHNTHRNTGRNADRNAAAPIQLLGAGFARDLTALLSLQPQLGVVASSSLEHSWQNSPNPIDIAKQFNADYAVCGNIESHEQAFRLRVELIDTATSRQLWSDRIEEQISDLFVVQDNLSLRIARSLCSAVAYNQVQQLQTRREFNLNAYERIQLAEDARRNYSQSAAEFIIENLEAALAEQPNYAVTHALLAMQYSQNLVSGWCTDASDTVRKAGVHLQRAQRLAPNDCQVLMASGIAALMRGEHQLAMEQLERSLTQNPNEAHALAEYGTARFYVTRELAPTLALLEQAEQAAPQHPRYSIWAYRRGSCYYEAGQYDQSVAALEQAIRRTPNYHHTHLTKAIVLIAMQDTDAAARAIASALAHAPNVTCEDYLDGVQRFGLTVSSEQCDAFRTLWQAAARAAAE